MFLNNAIETDLAMVKPREDPKKTRSNTKNHRFINNLSSEKPLNRGYVGKKVSFRRYKNKRGDLYQDTHITELYFYYGRRRMGLWYYRL